MLYKLVKKDNGYFVVIENNKEVIFTSKNYFDENEDIEVKFSMIKKEKIYKIVLYWKTDIEESSDF